MQKTIRCCDICGKSNEESAIHFMKKANMNLCSRHYAQFAKHGHILEKDRKDQRNKYIIHKDYCEIELYDRQGNPTEYAKIDIEDIEKCKEYTWVRSLTLNKAVYVFGRKVGESKKVKLHRFILDYKGTLQIDHINRNPLDNRKNNLRIATPQINALNRSVHSATKVGNYYSSRFRVNDEAYYLGLYKTIEEAEHISHICKEKYINNKDEFIREYELIKTVDSLDKYIRKHHNNYEVNIPMNGTIVYIGSFATVFEARTAKQIALEDPIKYRELNKNNRRYHKEHPGIKQKNDHKWQARATIDGKSFWIGTYETLEEAQIAREHFLLEKQKGSALWRRDL